MGITVGITGAGIAEATPCRECQSGRPHCHGTLIRHGGHAPQCTEPQCTEPQCTEPGCSHPEVLLHSLTIDCEAIGCPCGADENRAGRLAI